MHKPKLVNGTLKINIKYSILFKHAFDKILKQSYSSSPTYYIESDDDDEWSDGLDESRHESALENVNALDDDELICLYVDDMNNAEVGLFDVNCIDHNQKYSWRP